MRYLTTFPFGLTIRKGLPWSSTRSTFNLWNFPSFAGLVGTKPRPYCVRSCPLICSKIHGSSPSKRGK